MDIEYLLALQQWRMAMGADFENALVLLFDTGATAAVAFAVLIVVPCPCVVRWCFVGGAFMVRFWFVRAALVLA